MAARHHGLDDYGFDGIFGARCVAGDFCFEADIEGCADR